MIRVSNGTVRVGPWPGSSSLGTFYADFAGNVYQKDRQTVSLADALTLTRASSKLADDAAGTWSEFATDVAARTDTGLDLGSASVTNYALGGDMAGGVAGSPGTMPTKLSMSPTLGLTRTLTFGTQQGLAYIEIRLSGTANATSIINTDFVGNADGMPTVQGERFEAGALFALVAGTLPTMTVNVNERDVSNANQGAASATVTGLTSSWQYKSAARTSTSATTTKSTSFFQFSVTNGQAVDFTLRVAAPSHLKGTLPTPIPVITTGATKTQAVDAASLLLPATPIDLMLTHASGAYRVAFNKSSTYALGASDLPGVLPFVTLEKAQDLRRRGPPLYDNFAIQADGNLPGRYAKSGQQWQNLVGSGGALVNAEIVSGVLISKVSGVSSPGTNCYSALVHSRDVTSMYAEIGFGPAGTVGAGATLISCTDPSVTGIVSGSVHIQFMFDRCFVQFFDPANYPPGASATDVGSFIYPSPMAEDGTLYLVGWRLVGTTLYVLGPDGIERTFTDAMFPVVAGPVAVWEHSFTNADGGDRVQYGDVYAGDDVFLAAI